MKMVSDGNLEQAVMKIQQEIERVRRMIAGVYSSNAAYAVGNFCIYNEVLYRCTTAISSGEAWDSTHWEVAVLADEIAAADA